MASAATRKAPAVTLIQFVNVFLMHSWLASALPFTPTQNSNLVVAISSCANPELVPISAAADACGRRLVAPPDNQEASSETNQQAMSLAVNR